MAGPFLPTILAAEAVMEAGTEEQKQTWLPGIAKGRVRGTLALWEPDYCYGPEGIQLSAESRTNGFVFNGTKLFVMDADDSRLMIVAARTGAK